MRLEWRPFARCRIIGSDSAHHHSQAHQLYTFEVFFPVFRSTRFYVSRQHWSFDHHDQQSYIFARFALHKPHTTFC
jgi:hypothetical protein